MSDMRELIAVETFQRALVIACWTWFAACWVGGLILGRRGGRQGMRCWVLASLAGPLVFALWRFYTWMVRVEPTTGYVGLHRVSVAALNLLVFVAVGVVVGLVLGRQHRSKDSAG